MKKSLFFFYCLLFTSLAFAQIVDPNPKETGSDNYCDMPCIDVLVHIYTDVEILAEFGGNLTAVNDFVMNNFNTASGLLDAINVNLILDGITNYTINNPWGNAPSSCATYRDLLGNQNEFFNNSANVSYLFTSDNLDCFGVANGVGTFCEGEELVQCGSNGAEGRDWILSTDGPMPGVVMAHEFGHILGSNHHSNNSIMDTYSNINSLTWSNDARNQICTHLTSCRPQNCSIDELVSEGGLITCPSGCIDINTACLRGEFSIVDPFNIVTSIECDQFCYDLGDLTLANIVINYALCDSELSTKTITFENCPSEFLHSNPPIELAHLCCNMSGPAPATVCVSFPDCITSIALGGTGQLSGLNVTTENGQICMTPLFCFNKTYEVTLIPTYSCGNVGLPVTWEIEVNDPVQCPDGGFRSSSLENETNTNLEEGLLIVSPNPFSDLITIDIQLPKGEIINGYQIKSTQGELVYSTNKVIEGSELLQIQGANFPMGVYYLTMESERKMYTRKLVKIH